jgi:23S rRNA (pseudouridine1915-N3)-methyltransferase
VGTRPPAWVREGYAEYTRRLGPRLKLALLEIEPGPRSAGQSPRKAIEAESRRLMAALHPDECVVALDERGTQMSTRQLADWLAGRMQAGHDLAFLIGGPDGFAAQILARSDLSLSLSRLTLPHALARVVLAEQLYRAVSILNHHPYHRD